MPVRLRLRLLILLAIQLCVIQLKAESADSCVISGTVDSVAFVDSVAMADSVAVADSIAFSKMPWYRQLMANGFRIHDPEVKYPKFPRLLLNIYDWGDRTFNSYDSLYVVGVGKNWKITSKSYNWMESYMLMFSAKSSDMLHIRSDIYNDFGAYLSFMAVSVGYTAKINRFLGGGRKNRSNLNFNFTCSRIYANLDITKTKGNTKITHFGKYEGPLPYDFDAIDHSMLAGEAFYIFNFSHYSHAAAYCYSKYQLKGAGSWLLGFSFNNQNINIDFSNLPSFMKKYLPDLEDKYHYRYTDYSLCGGYAHNWVMSPRRWLANITVFPSFGYRHSYHDATDHRRNLLASSVHMRFAFVYNHKALFASFNGRLDAYLYFNSKYTFFNSIESLSLVVGARF